MEIEKIDFNFSVCKVKDYSLVDVEQEFCFIGRTDEEKSLVCITENVPQTKLYICSNYISNIFFLFRTFVCIIIISRVAYHIITTK